jgi:AcrR family transcriptional regulator
MTEKSPAGAQWHERTVERSLKNARERAISRGDKFIKAAGELLRTTGKADFTVQEVVDRSGMSLRSFYHHFATKDDLLLGVIEEEVRRYIAYIRPKLDAAGSPVEKLELMLTTTFGSPHSDTPGARGMVLFHWNLAESRTDEFVATLAPQVEMIREILEEGIADGSFRSPLPVAIQASLVTHTLLSLLDMRVLGVELVDQQVTADQLVDWCLTALGTVRPPAVE